MDREPHVDAASNRFALVDGRHIDGLPCATAVTTVRCIATKGLGQKRARSLVGDLMDLFFIALIAPVGGDVLRGAIGLEFSDFEDAVLQEAARRSGGHRDP
jgi:hypothetical protein